jgi:fructosamine-3-kinase
MPRKRIFSKILKNPKITRLLPETGGGGRSEQTYIVKDGDNKYVLRKYKDKKEADEDAYFSKKVGRLDIIPRFYGQDGKNLLFEYIEGRDLSKEESLDVFRQMGEISAKAHRIKADKFNLDKRFLRNLGYLKRKKTIDAGGYKKIKRAYLSLKQELKPTVTLDVADIIPDNYRINKNGKVYWIDIEGLKPSLKGRGMGKAYLKWFDETQKGAFKEGYEKIAPMDWFGKKYETLSKLYFIVHNTALRIKEKRPLDKNLERIENVMKEAEKYEQKDYKSKLRTK